MAAFEDLTGRTFGHLLVIRKVNQERGKKIQWLCECKACGKKNYKVTTSNIHGRVSCGCLAHESNLHSQKDAFYEKLVLTPEQADFVIRTNLFLSILSAQRIS